MIDQNVYRMPKTGEVWRNTANYDSNAGASPLYIIIGLGIRANKSDPQVVYCEATSLAQAPIIQVSPLNRFLMGFHFAREAGGLSCHFIREPRPST